MDQRQQNKIEITQPTQMITDNIESNWTQMLHQIRNSSDADANATLTAPNKRLSKSFSRKKIALAAFNQLSKQALDGQFGAQEDELMKVLLDLDSKEEQDDPISEDILKDIQNETLGVKDDGVDLESPVTGEDPQGMDSDDGMSPELAAKLEAIQNLEDGQINAGDDEKGLDGTELGNEAKCDSEEHKKDTITSRKVSFKEDYDKSGAPIQSLCSSPGDVDMEVTESQTQKQSSPMPNSQNSMLQRQLESLVGRYQKSPNGSHGQNISSLLGKILQGYSKEKKEVKLKKSVDNSSSVIAPNQSKTNIENGSEENIKINCEKTRLKQFTQQSAKQLIQSIHQSKNQDNQMHAQNLDAKAQLLRQLSCQVARTASQKLQDLNGDGQSMKSSQLQHLLLNYQEMLKNKNTQMKDGIQSSQAEKGTFKTGMNGSGNVLKGNDQQDAQQSKDLQNSLSKFLGIQSPNTVPVSTTPKQVETEDINIENRKQSNSSETQNITEILAKLQNIQRQSSQHSGANNRQFQLQQRSEAVNNLKQLKSILAERSAAQQNQTDGNQFTKIGQMDQNLQKKDTVGQKTTSPNTFQFLNRTVIKKDIPTNQSLNKSGHQRGPSEINDYDLAQEAVATDVEMNGIKGKNESVVVSDPINLTEPNKEENPITQDQENFSDKNRNSSKVDMKSAAHHLELADKGSQPNSAAKGSEERAREEISSLFNMIKANPKYKHICAEDNGALLSIMSKLEGSIGITNQNKNSFENDKDKPSVPGQQSQEGASEALIAEGKMAEHNSGSMMNSDNQRKQSFSAILQQQIRDPYQQQQVQSKSSSNQDSSQLQFPQIVQKGQNNKDYSFNGTTQTTAGFTESNLTTVMSQTNGNVKGASKAPTCNQPQASLNMGEPTATAVTRQTSSFEIMDPRIKSLQTGFLLNNSSPLGKFNAQSSQIVESHQNLFRVPQSHQQQAVPVASASGQNGQTEKYGQFKSILQMLQTIDAKKETMQSAHKEPTPEFDTAKRAQEDKQMDTGIAAVARQAPRASQPSQAALKLPISNELEQKLKQSLSPQQMSQIKSIPGLAQLLNLDTPEPQMSPSKTQQPMLQEPPSGNVLKKLVLGNQNEQLQRSLSLQSNDYLASIAQQINMNGQNSHNQAPSSAVGGVSQSAQPQGHGANQGVSANQDGAAVAMNQQMLKAVRQFLVNQQNQQEGSGSRSVQYNQIQQLINTLTNEQMGAQQENNNTLASLRRSLSNNSSGAGLRGLLQQTKPSELASAQQTPINQLLGLHSQEKSATILSQVKALGLDLSGTPGRQDSFISKDIDSPSKLRMRTFLDRQRSTTTMNEFGKPAFETNADVQHNKQSQLQSLLLGASPNRNNQELSLLQNMINDEEDDRFGNIKMSDEEISPQENVNSGDGFLTGGPRLVVSHRSKGIKKDHGFAHLGHGGYAPHPTLALGQARSYNDPNINEGLLRSSDEKIQDKGEYYLIHRMNTKTKRLNQILQCKLCPMKFPKLCNLRDHVRIHKEDMPFKCSLCNKAFTQAGNRDRHESKRVCLRRNNLQNSPNKIADEADDSDTGADRPTATRNDEQGQTPSPTKMEGKDDEN